MPLPIPSELAALSSGCLLSMATTWLVERTARRCGVLDRPIGYKAHPSPTPLLGGLAVAAGTMGGFAMFMPRESRADLAALVAVAAGTTLILLAGLIDDIRGLNPRHKLAWQVAAASCAGLVLALLGVRLRLFLPWPPMPIVLLTAVWVVGITNAVNFLDNMNGLCAGIGAIAAFALALINLASGSFTVAAAAAALCGACIGFLPFNWPHARLFLGDTGSMLIGFLLAALSVMGVYTRGSEIPLLAVFAPVLVLGIPVLDAFLVVLLRLRAGHPPWVGDRRHISHRLVRRGMRPATAVATLWAASAGCGFGGVLLPRVGPTQAPLLLALLACLLGLLTAVAGAEGLGNHSEHPSPRTRANQD